MDVGEGGGDRSGHRDGVLVSVAVFGASGDAREPLGESGSCISLWGKHRDGNDGYSGAEIVRVHGSTNRIDVILMSAVGVA